MTIKTSAVNDFLNSSVENYDWIKTLKERDLDEILHTEFDPVPQFYSKPYKHQKACFILAYFVPEFLYWACSPRFADVFFLISN